MSEITGIDKKFQKELNAGITALILLAILKQSGEPLYGYQIAKLIEQENENVPEIKQGVLYPVLRSLEKNELLESRIEPSTSGPPRRYYQITSEGKETLKRWLVIWQETLNLVNSVLEGVSSD